MRTLTLALLALFLPSLASAATITGVWTFATAYTDSTPMPVADIASTTMQYGSCSGTAFGAPLGAVNVAGPGLQGTTANLAPGTYCLRAFVTTTTAKGGITSAFRDAAAPVVIPFPTPGAPTSFTVTFQ